jgi:hypothetical protein
VPAATSSPLSPSAQFQLPDRPHKKGISMASHVHERFPEKRPLQLVLMGLRWCLGAYFISFAFRLMWPEINKAEWKAFNDLIDAFEADERWM